MSLSEFSGVVAGLVFAVSASWYTIDVANKKVKASIATFFIFMLINLSQLASLIAQHVWHVVPFTLVGTVTSLLICLYALRNRRVYFELLDKLALIGALIGFLLWVLTKDAAVNLYIISLVNLVAFTPLIVKSFKYPDLETVLPWQLNLVASTFLILTIDSSMPIVWVVPVRQFICSLLLNIGLYRGLFKAGLKGRL